MLWNIPFFYLSSFEKFILFRYKITWSFISLSTNFSWRYLMRFSSNILCIFSILFSYQINYTLSSLDCSIIIQLNDLKTIKTLYEHNKSRLIAKTQNNVNKAARFVYTAPLYIMPFAVRAPRIFVFTTIDITRFLSLIIACLLVFFYDFRS